MKRLVKSSDGTSKWHLTYTALLLFNNFAYGISVTINSATLLDIGHIYSVSMDTMSYMVICISVGYLIGSLSSFLYAFLNRQLVLIGAVLLMALCTSLLPHYGHLWLAFTMMFFAGVGSGSWDSCVNFWLVEMHPKYNGAILQANMFFSGLGGIVAPLMVAPFVHGNDTLTIHNETVTVELRIAHLQVPFSIEGVLQSIVPLILLVTFFINRYQVKNDIQDSPSTEEIATVSPKVEETRHVKNRKMKLFLLGVSASFSMAAEMGYIAFSSALWQELGVMNAPDAARALSVFTAAYTGSRLVAVLVSLKLRPDIILGYHYALIVCGLSFLYFSRNSHTLVLVGNVIVGFAFAPMWPAMFAFTERHFRLSAKVCSMFAFLSALVTLIMPLVLGQLFTEFPLVIFLVEGIFIVISVTLFVVVRVLIKKERRN